MGDLLLERGALQINFPCAHLTCACPPSPQTPPSSHAPGGFAQVLRAELDGRPIALKLLLPQWCDPANRQGAPFRTHFVREAKFLGKLDHP